LERDLHDGAQQQVVALKVKLGIAATFANREGAEDVAAIIADVSQTTQDAVDAMRAVAHGIYPPLLEAEGLNAALVAAKRTIAIPMEIVSLEVDRYDRGVEESIYFAILGTINQAVDAGAKRAVVSLSSTDDTVRFAVDLDARPSDLRQVEDRMAALDGTVTTASSSNGWIITGLLPASIAAMGHV
jgi:signal transduction histidine kinase